MEVLNVNDRRCHEMFWMEKHVFCKLFDKLKSYGLIATSGVNLEEVVGMFLMILGHNLGNRMVEEQFQHSGETVSCQFEHILKVMMKLTSEEIRAHDNFDETPQYIRRNPKYWPYFKVIYAYFFNS